MGGKGMYNDFSGETPCPRVINSWFSIIEYKYPDEITSVSMPLKQIRYIILNNFGGFFHDF